MLQQKNYFLHIPKTAGRTLNLIFNKIYKDKFYRITTKNTKISPEDFLNRTHTFILPDLNRVTTARMISGHFYFGFHENFDDVPAYITFLRNPVERLLSEYYFVQNPNHYFHPLFGDSINDIDDYIDHPVTSRLHNLQCRMISGISIGDPASPEEVYQKAVSNLKEHFLFAGITEYVEFSLLELKKVLYWKKIPSFYAVNVNKDRPLRKNIPKNTLLRIKERECYDIKLYLFVLNNLRKKMSQYTDWRSEASIKFLNGPPLISRIRSGIGISLKKFNNVFK